MKMKKISILASFALTLGLSAACSDSDSDSVTVDPAPPSPTLTEPVLTTPTVELKLVGNTFSTPCLPTELLDITSSNNVISFNEAGAFQKNYSFFLGDSCGVDPYMTLETSGSFTDSGPVASDQTVSNIDFVVSEALLTIRNESLVITFNVNSYCGKSNWKKDEQVSLKGVTCEFFSTPFGTPVNDVYKIEDDVVFFGNSLTYNVKPGVVRPTGVERDISYRIQAL